MPAKYYVCQFEGCGSAVCTAGDWHVIMACRDFLKTERMARKAGISKDNYTTLHLDLSSLESVRQFVDTVRWGK